MKKLFLMLALIVIITISGCSMSKEKIKQEINNSKYCNESSDCVDIGPVCPFGCSIYVNINEAKRIRDLMKDYTKIKNNQCEYMCGIIPGNLECVNNRCEFVKNMTKIN
jgi:hypothetical protein